MEKLIADLKTEFYNARRANAYYINALPDAFNMTVEETETRRALTFKMNDCLETVRAALRKTGDPEAEYFL